MAPKRTLKALAVGSVMVDTIAVIAAEDIELVTMHNATASFLMLEQGRKIDSESISTHIGGGAANVGVSMRRLGLDVDVFATVGNDLNAEKIRETIASEGIGGRHVVAVDAAGTGTSVLISSHDQNAAIFTHRGANGHLTPDHVREIDFSGYDIVYAAPLSNQSAFSLPLLIDRARAAGCFIATNPGILQLTKRSEAFVEKAEEIDLLAINRNEAAALVPYLGARGPATYTAVKRDHDDPPLPPLLRRGFKAGSLGAGLVAVLSQLQDLGPKRVLVTDGADGAYLLDGADLYFSPAPKIRPKGTAGAGDAFNSTIVAALVDGLAPGEALKRGAVNAASVVANVDTQSGLLTAGELTEALKGHNDLICRQWTCVES